MYYSLHQDSGFCVSTFKIINVSFGAQFFCQVFKDINTEFVLVYALVVLVLELRNQSNKIGQKVWEIV